MTIKRYNQGNRKLKSNKEESKNQTNKCFVAKLRSQSVCSDSLHKDLLLEHEELLKICETLNKVNTIALAKLKNFEKEILNLKAENKFLVNQTKCFENTIEELVLQNDFLQKENKQLEVKNNVLLKEIDVLQNKNISLESSLNSSSSLILSLEKENEALIMKNLELFEECETSKVNNNILQKEVCDSKANFERLNKVTNFNKGKVLSSLVTFSKAHNDKSDLDYIKNKNSTRYAFLYTNFSASTSRQNKTIYSHDCTLFRNERKYFSNTKPKTNNIRIWIPANTIDHDKQLYIGNYYKTVICNENYIYKGSITPKWVWFPKN